MTERKSSIENLFTGLILVMFHYQLDEGEEEPGFETAVCLDRDTSGILLLLGSETIYYPWHRIEKIIPYPSS